MPAMVKIFLSKSQFTRGVQCHKALWLYRNMPELRALPDAATEARFEAGKEVHAVARELYPGGVLIEYDREKFGEKIRETRDAIARGIGTIYEAAFSHDDVLVMVDILRKGARGWELCEVKSSSSVKDHHLPDAAIQYHVLEGAGLKMTKASIVHLNREYVRDGDLEIRKLFTVSDVTGQVRDLRDHVRKELRKQKAMLQKGMPDIDIGPYCSDPFDCDFLGLCWKHIPEDSVFDLRGKGVDKFALYRKGIVKLKDIPLDILNERQRFQVEATLGKRDKINTAKVQGFLEDLWHPLCYLDFETFGTAIPAFDGSRPYDQVPFQYSLYLQKTPGERARHFAFLAEPGADPREELLKRLLDVVPKGACIVAYNAPFEINRLMELAERYPKQRRRIEEMIGSFVDLMRPFKQRHLYSWRMKGSYSLKAVLPALVPSLSYDGIAISDGSMAERAYIEMGATRDPKKREKLRRDLLEYCKLDTYGMVRIIEKMQRLTE